MKQPLLQHQGSWFGRTSLVGLPPVVETEQPVYCGRRVIMVLSQPLYNRTDNLASNLHCKRAAHAALLALKGTVFMITCQCSQLLLHLLFEPGTVTLYPLCPLL